MLVRPKIGDRKSGIKLRIGPTLTKWFKINPVHLKVRVALLLLKGLSKHIQPLRLRVANNMADDDSIAFSLKPRCSAT